MNILLWIIQGLLALLFLFAGITKLVIPTDVLMANAPPGSTEFPALFMKFIGLVETLGRRPTVGSPFEYGVTPGTPVRVLAVADVALEPGTV